ncbi:MAG: Ig-like domain-containing protein [Pseudomonadota bacterium]
MSNDPRRFAAIARAAGGHGGAVAAGLNPIRSLLICLIIGTLVGCGGGGSSEQAAAPPTATAPPSAPPPAPGPRPNQPPQPSADRVVAGQSGTFLIDVLANDTDPDGDALTLAAVGAATVGEAVPQEQQVRLILPDGFTGRVMLSYTVADGQGGSAQSQVQVDVGISDTSTNRPPRAMDDLVRTQPSSAVTVDVLANDSDDDGDVLALLGFSASANGVVRRDDNGTTATAADDRLVFEPAPGFAGTTRLSYTVSDGGATAEGQVVITVRADVVSPPSQVCGRVMIGPVRGATVDVFEIRASGDALTTSLAQSVTDANGQWCFDLPSQRPDLLVRAQGGRYFDPSDSGSSTGLRDVDMTGAVLESVLFSDATTTAITPLSTALVRRMRRNSFGTDFDAVSTRVRAQTATAFGTDVMATDAVNPLDPGDGTMSERQLAMTIGGVASGLNRVAAAVGDTAPSSTTLDAAVNDLADCDLDGRRYGEALALPDGRALPTGLSLNLEILRFRNNLAAVYASTPLVTVSVAACQPDVALPDLLPPQFVSLPGDLVLPDPSNVGVSASDPRLQAFFAQAIATDNRPGDPVLTPRLAGDRPLPDRFLAGSVNRLVFVAQDAAGNRTVSNVVEVRISSAQAPTANEDALATPEDIAVTARVLDNDSGNGTALDVSSVRVEQVSGPVVVQVDNAVGTLVVTPLPDAFGQARVNYSVANVNGVRSAVATLDLVIVARNDDAPIAADDSATLAENTSASVDVLANDRDPDIGGLAGATVEVDVPPRYGSAVVDAASRQIVYTPGPDFDGIDSLRYRVRDASGRLSLAATVTLVVTGINQPPSLTRSGSTVLDEDGQIDLIFAALDPEDDLDGSGLTVSVAPGRGTLTAVSPFVLRYQPAADTFGADGFVVTVSDRGGLASLPLSVSLTVNAINDPPRSVPDSAVTVERVPVLIDVLDNDLDVDDTIDPQSLVIVDAPAGGTATVTADGWLQYTSIDQFNGTDVFRYRVSDESGGASAATTVTVDVQFVDDPPTATGDRLRVLSGGVGTVSLLANDRDPEGALDPASLNVVSAPALSYAIDPQTGVLTVDATVLAPQRDALIYTVRDQSGQLSTPTRVDIAVWPSSDPDFDGVASAIEGRVGDDPAMASTRVVHVDMASSAASPDGASWATAYATLSSAMAGGVFNGSDTELTYVLFGNNTTSPPSETLALRLDGVCRNLVIIGSVADLEPQPQRVAGRWQTRLQPVGGQRPLEITGCPNIHLFGLELSDGTGQSRGGGALISSSVVTLHDLDFINNTAEQAGGALALEPGVGGLPTRVVVEDGLFQNNLVVAPPGVDGRGGAIDAAPGTQLELNRTRFWRNEVSQTAAAGDTGGGGAVFVEDATVLADDAVFAGNRSDTAGGAIAIRGNASAVAMRGLVVTGNQAAGRGGGALLEDTLSTVRIANALVTGNVASTGGGIYADSAQDTVLSNLTLAFNLALDGGAIWTRGESARFEDNVLTDNVAGNPTPSVGGTAADMLRFTAANTVVDVAWAGFGGTNNVEADPLFTVGYYLDHSVASRSPAIDHSVTFQSDDSDIMLDDRFTDAAAAAPDVGALDAGYHYREGAGVSASLFNLELVEADPAGQFHVLAFEPRAGEQPVGPGRRIFAAGAGGGASVRASRYTNSLADPIGNGGSTLAVDRGDGFYEVTVSAPVNSEFFIDLWIDTQTGPALVRYSVTIDTT